MRHADPIAPGGETGAALLTVLLLVALIAVIAGTALERLRLATQLGGNAVALDQARSYAFAAETLAITRISALLERNPTRVTLAGGWSGRPIPLPIPGGGASATITDGGNCFNLNGLVTETSRGVYAANPTTVHPGIDACDAPNTEALATSAPQVPSTLEHSRKSNPRNTISSSTAAASHIKAPGASAPIPPHPCG